MPLSNDLLAPLLEMAHESLRCPYPLYENVRGESPAYWSDGLRQFVVTRYDDIMQVLRRPDLFSSREATIAGVVVRDEVFQAVTGDRTTNRSRAAEDASRKPVLIMADPPLHTRHRRLVDRAFGVRRVASMEPGIRAIADELVDAFIGQGHVEFVEHFAVGLPVTVIADALGVERAHLSTFKRWSDDMLAVLGNTDVTPEQLIAVGRSQLEFNEYVGRTIDDVRLVPRDNIISDVVHARVDGDEFSTEEMLELFLQVLVAGIETTTKLITSGMLLLLEEPSAMAAVRADPALIPNMIEEALRLESPIQGLYRTATVDTTVGDVEIPAGSTLWLVYAAANRDPAQFPEPDKFDITRRNAKSHLAFAQGPHFCLGAALARTEARVAFETLLTRLDDIELDPQRSRFAYEHSFVMHGLTELHLCFTSANRKAEVRRGRETALADGPKPPTSTV